MPDALADLMAAKPAFAGDSEAEQLIQLSDQRLRPGKVDWLEVGAGDGRNLAFQIDRLSFDRVILAVALEPNFVGDGKTTGVRWHRTGLERYNPDRNFDWISLRHSAYYVPRVLDQAARLKDILKSGGSIALTHWSDECVLRRLHLAICGAGATPSTWGIESLAPAMAAQTGLTLGPTTFVETRLDAERALAAPPLAEALCRLACRGSSPTPQFSNAVETLREVTDADTVPTRRNGIAFLSKA